MKMYQRNRQVGPKRQKGMTLIELLVAGVISIIASAGMVILMSSTLGTGARTIKVTRVAEEMGSSMQFISRELRRANYHANYAVCFGDPDCMGPPTADNPNRLDVRTYINSVSNANGLRIANTSWGTNDCLWFWYDRDLTKEFGDTAGIHEPVGAFRRTEENGDGVGIIQMTTKEAAAPACTADWDDAAWVSITNPALVDVTTLEIDNSIATTTNYDKTVLYSFLDATTVDSYAYTLSGSTQEVERIGITMTGALIDAASPIWAQGNSAPTVELQEFIRVRNNTVVAVP